MSKFGAIPTHLICRFRELTKTEIITVSYLYAARNGRTGRCNPSRGEIARQVELAKSHVSPAIKGLEDKGWIVEEPNGNFILIAEPEKVTNSVTPKVTESVTGGLPISLQRVTDFGKNDTESVTPLNKDHNNEEQRRNNGGTPRSLADEIVVVQTQLALNTDLSAEVKRCLADSVPEPLHADWLDYAKARFLTIAKNRRSRDEVNRVMGYWLTDFKRDHKREYERIEKSKTDALPTAAEKLAADAKWQEQNPMRLPTADFVRRMPSARQADPIVVSGDRPS